MLPVGMPRFTLSLLERAFLLANERSFSLSVICHASSYSSACLQLYVVFRQTKVKRT